MTLVVIVALLLMTPWCLGPLVVWRTQTMDADPPVERLEIGAVTPDGRAFLEKASGELGEVGFRVLGVFRVGAARSVKSVTTTTLVLHEDADGVGAVAALVEATGPTLSEAQRARFRQLHVEIAVRFEDGSSISVSNAPTLSVFARPPERVAYVLRGVSDATQLVELHRRLVRHDRAGRRPETQPDAPEERLRRSLRRELESQLAPSYLRRDGDVFRPTLKGAALMVWKLLPPWKNVLLAREAAAAAALRERLGA